MVKACGPFLAVALLASPLFRDGAKQRRVLEKELLEHLVDNTNLVVGDAGHRRTEEGPVLRLSLHELCCEELKQGASA